MSGFTVANLEAIEAAIASGELSVSYDGKSVTYRSMKDLMDARDRIKAELEAAGLLTSSAPRHSLTSFSRD